MSAMPDHFHIVQAVRDSRPWDFSTKAGLCAFSDAVVTALHRHDPRWKHLKKSAGQNHCVDAQGRRHAVDVAIWEPTGQIVDYLLDAGPAPPRPPDLPPEQPWPNDLTWQDGPVGEYGPDDWYAPGVPNSGTNVPIPGTSDPVLTRLHLLEVRVGLAIEMATAALKETAITKQRLEAVNDRLIAVDAASVKAPLPPYEGEGSIGWFSRSFKVTSTPKP